MSCCEQEKGCQKTENLKGKPKDCTPEQIRKCHGDAGKHPCATKQMGGVVRNATT